MGRTLPTTETLIMVPSTSLHRTGSHCSSEAAVEDGVCTYRPTHFMPDPKIHDVSCWAWYAYGTPYRCGAYTGLTRELWRAGRGAAVRHTYIYTNVHLQMCHQDFGVLSEASSPKGGDRRSIFDAAPPPRFIFELAPPSPRRGFTETHLFLPFLAVALWVSLVGNFGGRYRALRLVRIALARPLLAEVGIGVRL